MKNRISIYMYVFVVLVFSTLSPAAQSAPRVPDLTVAASAIDAQGTAQPVNGYIEVSVTAYQNATATGGDPAASCHPAGPGVPNETVYFRFSVPDGAVSLSLAGSAITLNATPATTMIMLLYRMNDATESGCVVGDNAAPPVLNAHPVTSGSYLLMVGVPSGNTVSSGNLYFTMDFAPAAPISYDDFANAKLLKLPANPTALTWENSTYEAGEVISSCATTQRPSNSIWYKLTPAYNLSFGLIVLFTQAMGDTFYSNDDVIVTVFKDTGFGLAELDCISNSTLPSLSVAIGPGTYYIRFELNATGGMASPGMVSFVINNSIIRGARDFSVPGAPTVPDLSGWTVVNGSIDDGVVCAPTCEFVFTSAGPTEATVLKSKADMSILKFKKNDMVAMTLVYSGDTPNASASTRITYTDGTPATQIKLDLTTSGQVVATALIKSPNVGTVKFKLKNKDTNLGDELQVVAAFINAVRLGQTIPRGSVLPPPAPAGGG